MSRTYLHIQQAKYKEEIYKQQDYMERYRSTSYINRYSYSFPHRSNLGWHKLANKYEWHHERMTHYHENSKSCKQIRHKIARKDYLQQEIEYGFRPIYRPKFRLNKFRDYAW